MTNRWGRRLFVVLFVVVAFALGASAQDQLGISFTVEGLEAFRRWVQALGGWGPAAFVMLIVFRLFIGLSSHLILILGGLAFGAVGGVVWGCVGLLLSGLVLYFLAQQLGAEWVQRRFGEQYAAMVERINRVGALAIFAITAHPVGLLTPAHVAAGLVDIRMVQFAAAVALAAPIRTLPYVLLGTAVLDLSLQQSLMIGVLLLALFVLPLFSSTVRQWLWGAKEKI